MDTKYRPGRWAKAFSTKQALVEVELKARGGFVARFFTFGGPDSDGDIQVSGSIVNEGATVPVSSWGHGSWTNSPPVGQAVLSADGKGALASGNFYLATQAGREHFEIVKAAGRAQQWSYGFDIVDHDYDGDGHRVIRRQVVHEISPVLRGAGLDTELVSIDGGEAETRAVDLAAIKSRVVAASLAGVAATVRARHELARFQQMRR
jgi:hypothetical protein